jgi:hypothetical protein
MASRIRIAARNARSVRRRERRRHGVADGLHDRAALGHDRRQKLAKAAAHEIEGGEIPDPVVERGRAAEVGEEDREACDLEPLLVDTTPSFPVEVRDGEIWAKTTFSHVDPATHWRQRDNGALAATTSACRSDTG